MGGATRPRNAHAILSAHSGRGVPARQPGGPTYSIIYFDPPPFRMKIGTLEPFSSVQSVSSVSGQKLMEDQHSVYIPSHIRLIIQPSLSPVKPRPNAWPTYGQHGQTHGQRTASRANCTANARKM